MTLEVEVAYELNGTATDLDVELTEQPSLNNFNNLSSFIDPGTIQKTFHLK